MTQEQQDKLRRALYNAKFTTDAHDENPFVGVYFDDLLAIIEEYVERPIYHEGWLAGEANLAKEYKRIQWIKWVPVEKRLPEEQKSYLFRFNDGTMRYEIFYPGLRLSKSVTHWMEIVPPEEEED